MFIGESKSLVPTKRKNYLGTLFALYFGRAGDEMWPKMTKNANLGPNLAVFEPKIPILLGGRKSFATNVTEKPPRGTLFALFFGRAWDEMGQKCQYLTKNAIFGPNLAKIPYFNFNFRAIGHLSGLTPVFGRFGL